jgi:hypothetical protein
MTLSKAIEILTEATNRQLPPTLQDLDDAMKLGIEALRRIKRSRKATNSEDWQLLPGETEKEERR